MPTRRKSLAPYYGEPTPWRMGVCLDATEVYQFVSEAHRRVTNYVCPDEEIAELGAFFALAAKLKRRHDAATHAIAQLIDLIDYLSPVRLGPEQAGRLTGFERLAIEKWAEYAVGKPDVPRDAPLDMVKMAVAAWRIRPQGKGRPKRGEEDPWPTLVLVVRGVGLPFVGEPESLKKLWERWHDDRRFDGVEPWWLRLNERDEE